MLAVSFFWSACGSASRRTWQRSITVVLAAAAAGDRSSAARRNERIEIRTCTTGRIFSDRFGSLAGDADGEDLVGARQRQRPRDRAFEEPAERHRRAVARRGCEAEVLHEV